MSLKTNEHSKLRREKEKPLRTSGVNKQVDYLHKHGGKQTRDDRKNKKKICSFSSEGEGARSLLVTNKEPTQSLSQPIYVSSPDPVNFTLVVSVKWRKSQKRVALQ